MTAFARALEAAATGKARCSRRTAPGLATRARSCPRAALTPVEAAATVASIAPVRARGRRNGAAAARLFWGGVRDRGVAGVWLVRGALRRLAECRRRRGAAARRRPGAPGAGVAVPPAAEPMTDRPAAGRDDAPAADDGADQRRTDTDVASPSSTNPTASAGARRGRAGRGEARRDARRDLDTREA